MVLETELLTERDPTACCHHAERPGPQVVLVKCKRDQWQRAECPQCKGARSSFHVLPNPPLVVADLRKSCVNANSVKTTKTRKISGILRENDLFDQLCFVGFCTVSVQK